MKRRLMTKIRGSNIFGPLNYFFNFLDLKNYSTSHSLTYQIYVRSCSVERKSSKRELFYLCYSNVKRYPT